MSIPREEAESKSTAAFKFVFENGPRREFGFSFHVRPFAFLLC